MNGMANKRPMAGFTLTELIVVMLIIGLLAMLAIPSFKSVTASNRITSEVNGLLGDMQFARSTAIKQGLPVTVCASTDNATCNAGASWQGGWIVFLDSNSNQAVDAGEAVVRKQPGFANTDTFLPDNGTFSAITFNREGYASTGSANLVTLLLHSTPTSNQWTRCLAITPVGMLNTQHYGTGSCT